MKPPICNGCKNLFIGDATCNTNLTCGIVPQCVGRVCRTPISRARYTHGTYTRTHGMPHHTSPPRRATLRYARRTAPCHGTARHATPHPAHMHACATCTRIYACARARTHVRMNTRTERRCVNVCAHARMCARACACACACAFACACACACVRACACACRHVCRYVRTVAIPPFILWPISRGRQQARA